MRVLRIAATLFTFILLLALSVPAYAAPLDPRASSPPFPLAVTPSIVRPGQTIHVSVSGLAGEPVAGQTGCLGILGPGQNVEHNVSPQFRPQIGTMAVATNGTGHADATVPTDLVGGSYRVIFGGCSPHGNIAPLSTVAQATIAVVGPTPAPSPTPELPASGGVPLLAAILGVAIGGAAMTLGVSLRKR